MKVNKDRVRELRASGYTYQRISDELNTSESNACRICKGRERPHPRARLADAPAGLSKEQRGQHSSSLVVGTISEALVSCALLSLGFDVWKPFMDRHRCDMGILIGTRLLRVQVKTASYEVQSKRFRASLSTKLRGKHVRYDDWEIDFFIVRCPGNDDFYIIPAVVGNRLGSLNLYPHREKLTNTGLDLEQYRNNWSILREAGVN